MVVFCKQRGPRATRGSCTAVPVPPGRSRRAFRRFWRNAALARGGAGGRGAGVALKGDSGCLPRAVLGSAGCLAREQGGFGAAVRYEAARKAFWYRDLIRRGGTACVPAVSVPPAGRCKEGRRSQRPRTVLRAAAGRAAGALSAARLEVGPGCAAPCARLPCCKLLLLLILALTEHDFHLPPWVTPYRPWQRAQLPPELPSPALPRCRAGGSPGVLGGCHPCLFPSCLGSDSTARKEREVMLRLKEVVDKQRDEIRAQAHEIVCKSRDTEALQEQLNRFMCMNEDLRHKVAVVQAQLKSALEKKSDLEAVVLQTQREMSRRTRTASEAQPPKPSLVSNKVRWWDLYLPLGFLGLLTFFPSQTHQEGAPLPAEEDPLHQGPTKSPAHCCFSKEELQQILQERNELKTNLFLVQEELAYYQRELLNEERIPSFFLDAMKSTIKKQRRKIRAKMLGTAEEPASR
nr:PREDICTED: rab-interacting lysosomal protein [Struthio camelus australis]